MKTASKVLRYVALGLSIALLSCWAYSVVSTILVMGIFLIIPIYGWLMLLVCIPALLLALALSVYPILTSIMSVVKLAKNKQTIAIGVMMITTSLFVENLFILPIAAGVLTILSAVFAKKAKEQETQSKD